ncbi:MAG: hypothetical protein R3E34_01830 [Rhodocyclaceae bacterium]
MNPPELAALIAPDGQVGLLGALLLGLSMGLTAPAPSPACPSWAAGCWGAQAGAARRCATPAPF